MNKSKAKGTAGETACVNYLSEQGIYSHRKTLSGPSDKGDIAIPINGGHIVVEVKNEKKTTLSEYVDEANVEAENAKALFGVAWHKRRGKGSPGDWYITMDGKTFIKILKSLNLAPNMLS